jgi:hypothetical protein
MAVLDAGEIGAKKVGASFDVTLGEVLLLAKFAESFAKYHCGIVSLGLQDGNQRNRREAEYRKAREWHSEFFG